jgi:hypothetical protein
MIRSKLDKHIDRYKAFIFISVIIFALFLLAFLLILTYEDPPIVAVVSTAIVDALALTSTFFCILKHFFLLQKRDIARAIAREDVLTVGGIVKKLYHYSDRTPESQMKTKMDFIRKEIEVLLKKKYLVGFRLKNDELIPTRKKKEDGSYFSDFDDPTERLTRNQETTQIDLTDLKNNPPFISPFPIGRSKTSKKKKK